MTFFIFSLPFGGISPIAFSVSAIVTLNYTCTYMVFSVQLPMLIINSQMSQIQDHDWSFSNSGLEHIYMIRSIDN